MAHHDNTNRGTLGKNRSPKHDKSPHFTGKVDVRGQQYWLAGWRQEDFMTDADYISLAITHKDDESIKGSGRLIPNPDKIGNQPDMKGTMLIAGAEFTVAAWTKSHANGKFLSISVDAAPVKVAQRNTNEPHGLEEPPMDFDDSIPF